MFDIEIPRVWLDVIGDKLRLRYMEHTSNASTYNLDSLAFIGRQYTSMLDYVRCLYLCHMEQGSVPMLLLAVDSCNVWNRTESY